MQRSRVGRTAGWLDVQRSETPERFAVMQYAPLGHPLAGWDDLTLAQVYALAGHLGLPIVRPPETRMAS